MIADNKFSARMLGIHIDHATKATPGGRKNSVRKQSFWLGFLIASAMWALVAAALVK